MNDPRPVIDSIRLAAEHGVRVLQLPATKLSPIPTEGEIYNGVAVSVAPGGVVGYAPFRYNEDGDVVGMTDRQFSSVDLTNAKSGPALRAALEDVHLLIADSARLVHPVAASDHSTLGAKPWGCLSALPWGEMKCPGVDLAGWAAGEGVYFEYDSAEQRAAAIVSILTTAMTPCERAPLAVIRADLHRQWSHISVNHPERGHCAASLATMGFVWMPSLSVWRLAGAEVDMDGVRDGVCERLADLGLDDELTIGYLTASERYRR